MAKDDGKPTSTEKGKGKATDAKDVNGTSKNAADAPKDGEVKQDGEKLGLPEEELSDEDQKLKDDLDMLVERLQVSSVDDAFYCNRQLIQKTGRR